MITEIKRLLSALKLHGMLEKGRAGEIIHCCYFYIIREPELMK
jgi:hypothetical protein